MIPLESKTKWSFGKVHALLSTFFLIVYKVFNTINVEFNLKIFRCMVLSNYLGAYHICSGLAVVNLKKINIFASHMNTVYHLNGFLMNCCYLWNWKVLVILIGYCSNSYVALRYEKEGL